MNETKSPYTAVGINDPAVAKEADLPESLHADAQRATAMEAADRIKEHLRKVETNSQNAQKHIEEGGRLKKWRAEGTGETQSWVNWQKELNEEAELLKQQLADAEAKTQEYQDLIDLLPAEEKQRIVEERFDEAKRIQHIAVGVLLRERLIRSGKNVEQAKEQGIELALDRHASDQAAARPGLDHAKAQEIEQLLSEIKDDEQSPLEPRHYEEAARIYTWWIGRLRTDIVNVLRGSSTRLMSAITWQRSLQALDDIYSQIAEGLSGGKWFSR